MSDLYRRPRGGQKWPVATRAEIPPGERKLVEVEGRSIGLFNVNGAFVAALNFCPHEGAPVCLGRVGGTTLSSSLPGDLRWGREGEILMCPWHGWEFDLVDDGKALADRRRLRLFPVTVDDDVISITV